MTFHPIRKTLIAVYRYGHSVVAVIENGGHAFMMAMFSNGGSTAQIVNFPSFMIVRPSTMIVGLRKMPSLWALLSQVAPVLSG